MIAPRVLLLLLALAFFTAAACMLVSGYVVGGVPMFSSGVAVLLGLLVVHFGVDA